MCVLVYLAGLWTWFILKRFSFTSHCVPNLHFLSVIVLTVGKGFNAAEIIPKNFHFTFFSLLANQDPYEKTSKVLIKLKKKRIGGCSLTIHY